MEPLSVRNCLVLLLLVLSLLNLPHFTNASCSRPLQNDAILELYPDQSIYEELETVVLHCDPEKNYVGYGPGVIYCSNTSWVPDPIDRHCYEPCNAPPVESSVVHYDSSTLEEETVYRHDTIIQFACSEPETMSLFHPLGQESAICADGLWDLDELPVCLAKCLVPDGALQTGYYEHGATVKFSCEAGFRPNGDSTLECFDGQWSDTLTCEAIPSGTQVSVALTESDQTEQTTPAITTEAPVACQYPASSLDPDAIVDPVKDGYALFDIIDVRCNDAERMTSDGPDRFVCYSAELWVPYPEDFFCYSPCAAPSVDDSVSVTTLEGDFTEGIYLHGAIIEFSCTVLSRLLSGVTITSCADGVWVPDQVPTCVDVVPFEIKFEITHVDLYVANFVGDLAVRNSTTFIELETLVVSAIDSVYASHPGYQRSFILSFQDLTRIGVRLVAFLDAASDYATANDLNETLFTALDDDDTLESGSRSITIDVMSVLILTPCMPPNLGEDMGFDASEEPANGVWYAHDTRITLFCLDTSLQVEGPEEIVCENGVWIPETESTCVVPAVTEEPVEATSSSSTTAMEETGSSKAVTESGRTTGGFTTPSDDATTKVEPTSEAVPTTMSGPGETSHATTESVLHTSEGQEKTTVMTTESPLTSTALRTDGAGTESPLPPSTAPQLVEILTTLPEVTGNTGRISSANYQTTLFVTEEIQTNTGVPEKRTTETIATDVFSTEVQSSPDMITKTTEEESLPPSVMTTEGADLSTQSLSVTIFHLTTDSEKLSTVTEDFTTTDAQKSAVTTASESLTTSVDDSTTEISTTKSTTEDPCSSCNPTTEVCVDQECNCRPSKYRLTAGGQCQDTNSFVLNYRIILVDNNDAVFSNDLLNKESVAYRDIEVDITIAISTVYGGLQNFLGSEVLEFRNGSIVVSSLVYFSRTASISNDTVGNQVVDKAALDLDRINGTLSSYTLDTGSVSVTETDECTLGLEDCSEFAQCSETGEGGFSCTCLPGYHDAPGNQPAGLICISDATTESTVTEIPKAPGLELWIIIVIAVGGGAALLLFLVILICVVKRCRRGKSTHPEEPFESMKVKNEKEGQDIKPTSQPEKNTEL